MPWYPSAKACPAAIKPTVQCFFPTLYQVLLFDFSSFGEKLFFCLRGYRRAIARSAVQKQPERRALRPQARFGAQPPQAALGAEIGCSSVHPPPNRRRMGGGSNLAHHQQAIAAQSREARCKKQPERRALRPQARFGAQPPQAALGAEIGCSSVHPPPNRRRMGGGSNLAHHQQAIAAQSREARCKKQPERRALRPQARFGAQPPQAALGAKIGCSSVTPPPNRRRMGGGSNLAPPPTSYRHAAQSWHLT